MASKSWTREQLLVAFALYGKLPFGQFHSRNPEIIRIAISIDRTPSALAMKLGNIASLDPTIRESGRKGLTSASKADRQMWLEMTGNWNQFSVEAERCLDYVSAKELRNRVIDRELQTYQAENTIREVPVRNKQRIFRDYVLSAYQNRCCITGLSNPKLLIASHIKPWSEDEFNRLNPTNGLALNTLHDKAFDQGIITITEDFRLRVSQKALSDSGQFAQTSIIAYEGQKIRLPEKFMPDQEFLEFHRSNIFEKNINPL